MTNWLDVPIPEGGIAHAQACVTGYFNPSGELEYVVSTKGDAPTSTFVGLLEMAKYDLIEWAHEGEA